MINCKNCLNYDECKDFITPNKTFPKTGFCPAFRAKEICDMEDTITLMTSEDHKERFKAEYWQTKIRYERLKALNTKIEAANRTRCEKSKVEMPEHDCPDDILEQQQHFMCQHLHILEVRAEIENIEL